MASTPAAPLEPRKRPRQKRSEVTVDAVFQATIQVLLAVGLNSLTTTRVAERAGVSVGTLYQYFPNKQALLYAVLEQHLTRISLEVGAAALSAQGKPLDAMIPAVVGAYVRAKIARVDEARALYAVASELDTADLVKGVAQRGRDVLAAMLESAPGVRFEAPALTAFMLVGAMVGATRAMLEEGASAEMLEALPAHLTSLCLGYLHREALPLNPSSGQRRTSEVR
jgi:AcrR family transcriptional regulator